MVYKFMTQNPYTRMKNNLKQRNSAFIAVLHLKKYIHVHKVYIMHFMGKNLQEPV